MIKLQSVAMSLCAILLSACNTLPSANSTSQDVVPLSNDSAVVRPVTIDGLQDFENIEEGTVRLEGHTDERGTREYNIALGEARAKTIARMLQLQGVDTSQSRTVSYGEELPVDDAHNNDAWAKNRRVNIIYDTPVQN